MTKLLSLLFIGCICFVLKPAMGQSTEKDPLPVRGFCISAPSGERLDEFVKFINQELAPRKVNVMVLMINYNYAYESHPELRGESPLSKDQVKKIVAACRNNNIQIIPQVNMLGHQSWASTLGNLLKAYPQLDETPLVKMPGKYVWPNADGLYCKSYCPLHPDVHPIVFSVIDEICDVFEATAFHAGMDEVFYIGDDNCPRCQGRDKAELFAGEVNAIRNHLSLKNRKLWIWGDRLIDGKTTGIGLWEGSYNNTHRAIDMIYKDVVICDWHYERPDQTAVYFATKGLNVITCPWRNPENAVKQTQDMFRYRASVTPEMKERLWGMMQTVWSDADQFMDEFYGRKVDANKEGNTESKKGVETASNCFRAMYKEIDEQTSR